MQKKTLNRIYLAAFFMLLCISGLIWRLYLLHENEGAVQAGVRQGKFRLHVPLQSGTLYDRKGKALTNSEDVYYAVVCPSPESSVSLFGKVKDPEAFERALHKGIPFLCELTEPVADSESLIVLNGKRSRSGILPAQHILGYCREGEGVSGIEAAYHDTLRSYDLSADITLSVSGNGTALSGAEQSIVINGHAGGGIVTTLDYQIQRISDTALQNASARIGAAVVMDIQTGEILACASSPVYHPEHLEKSLDNPDAPFLNRALCAYSVGSVFKLVTAAAALENGLSEDYAYLCEGAYTVFGQRFRCHKLTGHGLLDMKQAMIESCNPYFISLGQLISTDQMHSMADSLGFGRETVLAPNMIASGGYLPDCNDLNIPAEKANLSFGQGKLTATPLQITAMTACIANDGFYHPPRLILGETADEISAECCEEESPYRVLRHETAAALQSMMIAVLRDSKDSKAVPCNIYAAGKTSTAQTGILDADGKEYCHAWMTGFFPAYHPQYAVTVLIENGGSGNDAAAPVFRRIIEEMRRAGY